MSNKIKIVAAGMKRTPIIPSWKSLANTPAHALMYFSARETIKSAGGPQLLEHIEESIAGTCFHDPRNMNVARVVSFLLGISGKDALAFLKDGVPLLEELMEKSLTLSTPAYTMSMNCGSGSLPLMAGADAIKSGRLNFMLAMAGESMSNIPYQISRNIRGQSLGDQILTDGMMHGLTDPFTQKIMGYTADTVAIQYGITRAEQDKFIERSHQRANEAVQSGKLDAQIAPITVWGRNGASTVTQDEGFNSKLTAQSIAGLKPYFMKAEDGGMVTAAGASLISDGAASMFLGTPEKMKGLDITPEAELLGYALAGCNPALMGMGPIYAIPKALERAGLTLADIDVFLVNEAFAATTLAVQRELEIPDEKLNPYGGALALGGHAVGATALVLPVVGVNILKDWDCKYLVVSGCVGGGQGYATVWKLFQ
jgi:acetyl-CoA C-acetyltransferase